VQVDLDEPGRPQERIVFSGDLGRYDMPVIPDPEPVQAATTLLVECTYGDRSHGAIGAKDSLAVAVQDAERRGGALVIPAFAIGRAQDILYYLRELEEEHRIPVLDVFVDSPMAIDATPIYARHKEEHDEIMRALLASGARPFHTRRIKFTRSVEESKKINQARRCIIISASGMATGGRVLHHLAQRLPDPDSSVLLVGYQGVGTRGRALQEGAREVKMLGRMIPVRAAVRSVSGFSAHADANEVMRWLDGFTAPPRRVLCVHGEPPGLTAMKSRVEARGAGWKAHIPEYLETVEL
jgi:metallo-beta-lactamase family protein